LSVFTAPANGTAVVTGSIITYSPNPDFSGSDSFVYEVCDQGEGSSESLCDTATVYVTVNPINDAPVAVDDSAITDEQVAVVIDVLSNDSDVEDGTPPANATVTVSSGPTHGTAVVNPDGSITYTPGAGPTGFGFFGTDSFDYQLCDSGTPVECDSATVTIAVAPVTDATLRWVGTTMMQSGGTVPLRVTVTSDDGGVVVGSTVTFAGPGVNCDPATVVELYEGAGDTVGTAFCMETLSAGSTSTIVVTASLSGSVDAAAIDQDITIFKNEQHTITGGGNLVLAFSAGELPANPGSKKNFGFNADSGKRGNRLKGDINIVYEFMNGGITDYQLKAPGISSIGHIGAYGEITGMAELSNLGTGAILHTGLILQVELIDGNDAEPPAVDLVAYTAWDPNDGHLVFATNWDMLTATPMRQGLDGGNIDIK
jgi:hypothetical protein